MKKRTILFLLLFLISTLWIFQGSGAVAAPPQQGQELALITEPENNAVVRGTIQIIGSADHSSFQFYILEFHPEPVTNDRWQIIGTIREQPVVNSVLETWDTTLVPDGSYTIRLRVVRLDGNYTEIFAQQVVVANTQPTATNTPVPTETPANLTPTATPTDLPPTPTVSIDQPVVDTPTPRPVETSPPLQNPDDEGASGLPIPRIEGFSALPLRNACLYGAALMFSIFIFFGFLSMLRLFIKGFFDRRRLKRE